MKKDLKIFVIVVTYKGQQWYDRCFGSLRESTIPVQTIAVDNTPGEEDAENIKAHFPEVHIIKTKENLGFGRANNLGMRYALDNGCDYVFLLNQDAWLDTPDALEKLVGIYEQHPEYGILSPMHLNIRKDGLVMEFFCRQPNNQKLIGDLYLNQLSDVYDTQYIHAAAWMLSRKTLETIGGFNPLYVHYGEDDDYLHRVIYHKMKIGVCPAARIVHDHHDKTPTGATAILRHNQKKLVEYTDLNKPFKPFAYLMYDLRKWIVFVIGREHWAAKEKWRDMKYLLKSKNDIKANRATQQQIGSTWL